MLLHSRQSIYRLVRSAIIVICTTAAPALSTDTAAIRHRLPFEIFACGSLRTTVLSAATQWKSYPTAGFYFKIPSTLHWLSCMAGGETGVITDKSERLNIQCIHLRFGIVIDNLIRHPYLRLQPEAGVSNMMIEGFDGDVEWKEFHHSVEIENEFGFFFGLEPGVVWKKLRFCIPVRFERTFSSPDRFDAAIISVLAGYHFDL